MMPQEDSGLASTQHQPRLTPLGWINGKLQLLLCPPDCPQRKGEGFRYCVVELEVYWIAYSWWRM